MRVSTIPALINPQSHFKYLNKTQKGITDRVVVDRICKLHTNGQTILFAGISGVSVRGCEEGIYSKGRTCQRPKRDRAFRRVQEVYIHYALRYRIDAPECLFQTTAVGETYCDKVLWKRNYAFSRTLLSVAELRWT